MSKTKVRNFILTCLLLLGIGTILAAARDNAPSQDVMIAIVSGEVDEDAISTTAQPPEETSQNNGFFRIVATEEAEGDDDGGFFGFEE